MNRDRRILSAVPYPITQTSNIPEWRNESTAMSQWRGEGALMPRDEWDDKWLRPLLIMPKSHVPPSQPAKANSAPEKCVVEVLPKRADAGAEDYRF